MLRTSVIGGILQPDSRARSEIGISNSGPGVRSRSRCFSLAFSTLWSVLAFSVMVCG